MEFIVLLGVKCDLDVEATQYVLCELPSRCVEGYSSKECGDVPGAVSRSKTVYSGVGSDWAVCVWYEGPGMSV